MLVSAASRLEFAFSEVVYEVREGERFVAVVIELISGTVTSLTPITVSTSDLSAVGEWLTEPVSRLFLSS